jgi:hypothetical protein
MPEIDRFPKETGITPDHSSAPLSPAVEKLPSSPILWKELAFRFSDDVSLDLFANQMNETIGRRGDEHLIVLFRIGSLRIEASGRMEALLAWDARLLRLKLHNKVSIARTAEEIEALTSRVDDPLIATVARKLVSRSNWDDEESTIARLALRELHSACIA